MGPRGRTKSRCVYGASIRSCPTGLRNSSGTTMPAVRLEAPSARSPAGVDVPAVDERPSGPRRSRPPSRRAIRTATRAARSPPARTRARRRRRSRSRRRRSPSGARGDGDVRVEEDRRAPVEELAPRRRSGRSGRGAAGAGSGRPSSATGGREPALASIATSRVRRHGIAMVEVRERPAEAAARVHLLVEELAVLGRAGRCAACRGGAPSPGGRSCGRSRRRGRRRPPARARCSRRARGSCRSRSPGRPRAG